MGKWVSFGILEYTVRLKNIFLNYNMAFIISSCECYYFLSKMWIWCSKQKMICTLLPLLHGTVPLNEWNCHLAMQLFKENVLLASYFTPLILAYLIVVKAVLPHANMFAMNLQTSFQLMLLILTSIGDCISLKLCQCFYRGYIAMCWPSLTHWGRVTHICVSKLTIIGSDNGLSPVRHQTIIWTNAWILLIWPLVTNFNEIPTEIYIFSFKKMHLKMSSGKWQPSCLCLNVLIMKVFDTRHI